MIANLFVCLIHICLCSDGFPIKSLTLDNKIDDELECMRYDDYALIVHGWTESCNQRWATELVRSKNILF